jgi:hypothetical protein
LQNSITIRYGTPLLAALLLCLSNVCVCVCVCVCVQDLLLEAKAASAAWEHYDAFASRLKLMVFDSLTGNFMPEVCSVAQYPLAVIGILACSRCCVVVLQAVVSFGSTSKLSTVRARIAADFGIPPARQLIFRAPLVAGSAVRVFSGAWLVARCRLALVIMCLIVRLQTTTTKRSSHSCKCT